MKIFLPFETIAVAVCVVIAFFGGAGFIIAALGYKMYKRIKVFVRWF